MESKYSILQTGVLRAAAIQPSSASFYPRNYANYVMIQIENSSTGYTPDQYLNSLMLGDAADHKDFPDIRFNQNTTNNIVVAATSKERFMITIEMVWNQFV